MGHLNREGSNAVGLIVGGADARRKTYAESIHKAAESASNVRMVGHRDDLREIMSISSVVLSLSSHPESFGRTVLEALSLGIPVAGFDHGGVGEVLRNLFPPGRVPLGDEVALRQTVSRMLNESKSGQIAQNTEFTLSQMVARTLKLYESVGQDI